MRHALRFVPRAVALAAALFAGAASPVTSVYDGDTFRIGEERVRVVGLDTPERGGRAACDAERFLAAIAQREAEALLMSDSVEIVREPRADRYGRTLARVFVDGRDFADIMVERSLAVPWAGRRHDWCAPKD